MAKKRLKKIRTQYGAVPYRFRDDGGLEVLLITTRETQRWMIPKGWPMKKKSPVEAAAREAFEEAGVVGTSGGAVGAFEYLKVLRSGPNQLCNVEVFPLRVDQVLDDWPERSDRERRWFTPEGAAEAVQEKGLSEILQGLPKQTTSLPECTRPAGDRTRNP